MKGAARKRTMVLLNLVIQLYQLPSGTRVLFFLREGPCSQGAFWGSAVPEYRTAIRFFKFVWCFRLQVFREFFPKKRLELKSLKGQTKAEELGAPCPELLSLRLSLKAL